VIIDFYKYQGTGNDFILLDNRKKDIVLSNEQIKFLCNRHFGIGADGLMLLENEVSFDFKMVYYNSDGNLSSMCGNGGRCIAAFAKKLQVIGSKARFLAIDGPHDALINDNNVALKMQDVKSIERGDGYFYLNTGSPHFVKTVNHIESYPVFEEGKKIRNSKRFAEVGTNVNFIERFDDYLYVRTYERGVENETLSCGTGVTAAALVAATSNLSTEKNSCVIKTPGGFLKVSFDRVLEHTFYNIWLEGSAEFVFKGSIELS
jgi:diaminopimelate epimerase